MGKESNTRQREPPNRTLLPPYFPYTPYFPYPPYFPYSPLVIPPISPHSPIKSARTMRWYCQLVVSTSPLRNRSIIRAEIGAAQVPP